MTQIPDADRIEKQILLRAPRTRVWTALTDPEQFGAWFGCELAGPFKPGEKLRGRITAKGYEHLTMELAVERVHPETSLAFRWHPYAIEVDVDYSSEPMTLVQFELEEREGGTLLKVVESGFEQIPIARRATAFRMNGDGWSAQVKNIERYLGQTR
jgi:uncharacterized protein YndB with AHSA1/START domain